jgi:anti-sigma regulatory factor (Ser/Thr protein kinase)
LVSDLHHNPSNVGLEEQPITLVIPCRAEYLALCRLLAGVVGAREGWEAEDIADIKLVVTEACTCFLWGLDGSPSPGEERQTDRPPASIRVDFAVSPEAWEVTVSDPEHGHHISTDSRCHPASGGGLGLTIMKALVDSVVHTDSETEGSVIHLVKRVARGLPQDA